MNEFDKVIKIKDQKGHLLGIVEYNIEKKALVFYECKAMGLERVKELLDTISINQDVQKIIQHKA